MLKVHSSFPVILQRHVITIILCYDKATRNYHLLFYNKEILYIRDHLAYAFNMDSETLTRQLTTILRNLKDKKTEELPHWDRYVQVSDFYTKLSIKALENNILTLRVIIVPFIAVSDCLLS